MAQYLVIKNNNNSTKQYECKDSPIGAPYLKVNNKAIDLTTKTVAGFDLCIKPKVTSIKEQISSEYTYNTTDYNGFSGSAMTTVTLGYRGYVTGLVTSAYSGLAGYKGTVTYGYLSHDESKNNSTLNVHTYKSATTTSSNYYDSSTYSYPYTRTSSSYTSLSVQQTRFVHFTSPEVSHYSAGENTSLTTNINYAQKSFNVYVTLSGQYAWDWDDYYNTHYTEYNLPAAIYTQGASSSLYNTTALVTTSNIYTTDSTTHSSWSSTAALVSRLFTTATKTNIDFLINASNITTTAKRSSYGYSTATKTANTSMIFRPGLYSNKQLEKIAESTISYSGSLKTTSSYAQSFINFSGTTYTGYPANTITATIYDLLGLVSEIRYVTSEYTPSSSYSYYNTLLNGSFSYSRFYNGESLPIPVFKGTGTVRNLSRVSSANSMATYKTYGDTYTTTSSAYCWGTWRGMGSVGYPYTKAWNIFETTSVDWNLGQATWSGSWIIYNTSPVSLLSGTYNYETASTTTTGCSLFKLTEYSSGEILSTLTNSIDCKFKPENIISSYTSTSASYMPTESLKSSSLRYSFYDNGYNYLCQELRNLRTNYATSSSYVTLKITSANTNNMSNTYALIKTYNSNQGTTLITY